MAVSQQFPVFVVTLRGADERQAQVAAGLRRLGLDFSFFYGVDGRVMTAEERGRLVDHERRKARKRGYVRAMAPAELGCSLSHRNLYQHILDNNHPHALILEDDAVVGPSLPGLASALIARFAAEVPAVVLLTHAKHYRSTGASPLADGYTLVRTERSWLTSGYFVTRSAARILRKVQDPVYVLADDWDELGRYVPVYGLHPYAVTTNDGGVSTITGGSRIEEAAWVAEKRRLRYRPDIMARRVAYGLGTWLHELRHMVRDQPVDAYRP